MPVYGPEANPTEPFCLCSAFPRRPQSTLNRFLSGKAEALKGPRKKRPYLASECRDLNEADKWRQDILREIGKKVMEIQNAALGASPPVRQCPPPSMDGPFASLPCSSAGTSLQKLKSGTARLPRMLRRAPPPRHQR